MVARRFKKRCRACVHKRQFDTRHSGGQPHIMPALLEYREKFEVDFPFEKPGTEVAWCAILNKHRTAFGIGTNRSRTV